MGVIEPVFRSIGRVVLNVILFRVGCVNFAKALIRPVCNTFLMMNTTMWFTWMLISP